MTSLASLASIGSAGASLISGSQQYGEGQYNAELAKQNATAANIRGQTNAYLDTQKGNRKIGAMQAAYGATGVKDTGTPLSKIADQAMQNHLATSMDRYNAAAKAYSYKSAAKNDRRAGRSALTSGILKGGVTLANHYGS